MSVREIIATLIIGLFVGFIFGAFVAVGTANKVISVYAENSRLYYCDEGVFEINEISNQGANR